MSYVDSYKHLNDYGTDMENVARDVLDENYGLHRFLSAVYKQSEGLDRCIGNEDARKVLKDLISLL
jgi:hypothetical protein